MASVIPCESATIGLLDGPKPVIPRNISMLYQDGLVLPMVADSLEKDPTSKQRYLKGLDVNIDPVFMPCVSSEAIGDKSCEQPIEVEKEEKCQDAANEQLYQKDPAIT